MGVFNSIDGADTIDRFEIEDDKIIVYYCDNTYKDLENTEENQRVLLVEELNCMKRIINHYKDTDFAYQIDDLNNSIKIANRLELAIISAIMAVTLLMYEKINISMDSKILLSGAIYNFANHINTLFNNVVLEYVTKQRKLEIIEEMVERNKLYINNIELFEKPIPLEDKETNRDTGMIKITPNNIDDYNYDDIRFCIKVLKKTKELETNIKKER